MGRGDIFSCSNHGDLTLCFILIHWQTFGLSGSLSLSARECFSSQLSSLLCFLKSLFRSKVLWGQNGILLQEGHVIFLFFFLNVALRKKNYIFGDMCKHKSYSTKNPNRIIFTCSFWSLTRFSCEGFTAEHIQDSFKVFGCLRPHLKRDKNNRYMRKDE